MTVYVLIFSAVRSIEKNISIRLTRLAKMIVDCDQQTLAWPIWFFPAVMKPKWDFARIPYWLRQNAMAQPVIVDIMLTLVKPPLRI